MGLDDRGRFDCGSLSRAVCFISNSNENGRRAFNLATGCPPSKHRNERTNQWKKERKKKEEIPTILNAATATKKNQRKNDQMWREIRIKSESTSDEQQRRQEQQQQQQQQQQSKIKRESANDGCFRRFIVRNQVHCQAARNNNDGK